MNAIHVICCAQCNIAARSTLAASIPQGGPDYRTYLPPANDDSIFIEQTNTEEIGRIISKLNNSAPGHDEVKLQDIKPVLNVLVEPLTYVTNLSLLIDFQPN